MSRADRAARAKAAYVATLRAAGRVVPHGDASTLPDRTRRTRHWLASLSRVHDPLGLAELDVPWWTYRAIDAVERWLVDRDGPIRAFEYGSGASTLWLARRADEVVSVEHVAAFATLMAPALAGHHGVTLRTVDAPASPRPAVASARERGLDFASYVAAIDDAGGAFDLIVIDGRARAACLQRAVPRLAADGLIVFDNSRRRRYRAAIEECGLVEHRHRGLTPTLPYPEQTSLLSARR